MSDRLEQFLTLLVGVILGLCIGLCIGGVVFKSMCADAVKHGAAYWHVHEDGTTEFRWKESEVEK